MIRAVIAILAATAGIARADDVDPADDEVDDAEEDAAEADARRDAELARLRRDVDADRGRLDALAPLARYLTAYVDVGFFAVGGDGSGVRPDTGHLVFPEYAGLVPAEWVLMGDPLSTAINARGEPADLGASRALREDTVDSAGRPGVIVNALGLAFDRDVTSELALRARVELQPRSGGDVLDVQLARIEYRPSAAPWLWLAAGKLDSALGVEYRRQDPVARLTVTPSLICRYTCGFPVGVQARAGAPGGAAHATLAVTAGDSLSDRFEPDPQLVSDSYPTVSGRLAYRAASIGTGLELGVSGAIGPRDGPPDAWAPQWHVGVDLRVDDLHDLELQAEYVQGNAPGDELAGAAPCGLVACLRYKGAYGLVGWRARNWLEPYLRVDWRDAVHGHGVDFVYVSKLARATAGVRLEVTRRASAKVEYTHNRELGPIPSFANDVLTAALVVSTN